MIIDAFMLLIKNNLEEVIAAAVLALVSIGALVAALIVFQDGTKKVLGFISGKDLSQPKVGHQYEEFVDGKPVYRTWTRKDKYYYEKARSRR